MTKDESSLNVQKMLRKERLQILFSKQVLLNSNPCRCDNEIDVRCGCDQVDRDDFMRLLEILLDE